MQLFNSTKDYGAIPQALHWLTVFLVAGLFVHISAGIAILALLVARVISRMVDPSPQPEATEFGAWMGKWLDPASRIAHFALYALLFAVPVAGIILCAW